VKRKGREGGKGERGEIEKEVTRKERDRGEKRRWED
jgi:hypothetical protein